MDIAATSALLQKRWPFVLLMLVSFPVAMHGQNKQTASDWAWDQIRAGQIADFNARCGKELDPRKDAGWNDECRHIPAKFLQDVLADPSRQAQAPRHRVRLRGARIEGSLELDGADIGGEVWIDASRIDGGLEAYGSNWPRNISLEGTRVAGDVRLDDAKVGGQLNLKQASFAKPFYAQGLRVQGDLIIDEGASFGDDVTLSDAIVGGNLEITGASFAKGLDAERVSVGRNFIMNDGASFGGDVVLRDATVGGELGIISTSFANKFSAERINVGSVFVIDKGASFAGDVNLGEATVKDDLEITGASFARRFSAARMNVGSVFVIDNGASFGGDVILSDSLVGVNLDINSASFVKGLSADGITVRADLAMGSDSRYRGDVDLEGASVGNLFITHASFDKTLNATAINVGGGLAVRQHTAFHGDVTLTYAKIGGSLFLFNYVSFAGKLVAAYLIVGGDLVMDKDLTFNEDVNLMASRFGGRMLLSGTFASLQLGGTVVAQELNILNVGWHCVATEPTHWYLGDPAWENVPCPSETGGPSLNLRNVQAGNFQDDASVWPPSLDLEGFRYERIGGFRGTGSRDMRARSLGQWDDWLARDRTFSTQPYVQLAGVLLAAGQRNSAEGIQFAMRERERQKAWLAGDLAQWAWLTTLCFIAGYGIGLFTFRVLWWVLTLAVLGAVILRFSPNARRWGWAWQLGASLHRLLPVVELNKEFKDFFENPAPSQAGETRNLNRFQCAFFAGFAIAGWILGIFLLAALGGLMPKG